jgi:hypothetical protein
MLGAEKEDKMWRGILVVLFPLVLEILASYPLRIFLLLHVQSLKQY